MAMGSRSFWRTYNLISALGSLGLGVAFIIGGLPRPGGPGSASCFGGLVCFLVAG